MIMNENSPNKLAKEMSEMLSRASLFLIWLNGPFLDKKMVYNMRKMQFFKKLLFYPRYNLYCNSFFVMTFPGTLEMEKIKKNG